MVSKGTCTIEQVNQYLNALLTTDYHKDKHSVTKEKPGERYFNFPEEYRRFVSLMRMSMYIKHALKENIIGFIWYNMPPLMAHMSKYAGIRKIKKKYMYGTKINTWERRSFMLLKTTF